MLALSTSLHEILLNAGAGGSGQLEYPTKTRPFLTNVGDGAGQALQAGSGDPS